MKKIKFKPLDKFLCFMLIAMILSAPVLVVYSKSLLSKSNIEVERIRKKLEKQEVINESLTMKINELASLTNIQDIAKEHGLSYNNDNILIIK